MRIKRILAILLTSVFILGALAGCGSSGNESAASNGNKGAAGNDVTTLRLGIMVSGNTAHGQAANYFKELVEEKTGGKIIVEVYTDGVLGNETEMWEAIQSGSMDMMWTGDGAVSAFVPEYGFVALPYVFADTDNRDAFIETDAIAELDKIVEDKGNVVVLGHGSGVARNLLATKPVKSLKDAQGLSMRVQASDIVVKTWESLGLLPVVIAYAETYSALQTGVAKACENETSTFITQKWYECAPYLIKTEHQINCHPLIIGKNQYSKLTEEQQAILKECGKEAGAKFTEWERANDAEGLKEMVDGGTTICELTDKQIWIDTTKDLRNEFYAKYGLEGLAKTVEGLR